MNRKKASRRARAGRILTLVPVTAITGAVIGATTANSIAPAPASTLAPAPVSVPTPTPVLVPTPMLTLPPFGSLPKANPGGLEPGSDSDSDTAYTRIAIATDIGTPQVDSRP